MPRSLVLAAVFVATAALAACGGASPTPIGDPVAGREAFLTTCITCHGQDAKGVTGLGKDLTTSEFIRTQTDEQLLAFLMTGRPASDPLNTTGVDMPPRGGNPAFTDEDLENIVAYLRTIQE